VIHLRIKPSILSLAVLWTCIALSPPSYCYDDRREQSLVEARNELLKKQDELAKEESNLQHDIDSLSADLKDKNDPRLYDELRNKSDELKRVQYEIDKNQDALKDVERNLRG